MYPLSYTGHGADNSGLFQFFALPAEHVSTAAQRGHSGDLPHWPQSAQCDAVGHHGHQVYSEEQHVQHVADLQPLLGHFPGPVPLLQEVAYCRHFLQDVVHDRRGGVPGGDWGQAHSDQASFSVMLAEPSAYLTGVVVGALGCRMGQR